MGGIDWTNIPLEDYLRIDEEQEDGTVWPIAYPHGDGVAQRLMMHIQDRVENAYEGLLLRDEDRERYETAGEVPVIRDGRKVYEPCDSLTLADLPTILDTLAAMDQEVKRLEAEEAARRDAERKRRRNALARESRKLKKLGEW
jgi:hypothetical protein